MELVAQGLTNTIAWLAMLVGVAFAIWWAVGLLKVHSREQEASLPEIESPEGIKEKFTGVPAVLVIFFIFMGVTLVSYLIAVWLTGVTY